MRHILTTTPVETHRHASHHSKHATSVLIGIFFFLTATPIFALNSNSAFTKITTQLNNIVFYKIAIAPGTYIPLIVAWLIAASLFLTLYFGFINIRGVRHAVNLIRGKYDNPKDPGIITHFQALATALSGTVGIGNIGGVAIAISYGGPGAAFWLFVAGFFAMSTKFVECALAVKYRKFFPNNIIAGGPMYYLRAGLTELKLPRLGKFLAYFYAVCMTIGCFGIGNMFQSNQAFAEFVKVTGDKASFFADKGWLFGLIMAILLGAIIIGGIKSIAKVTSRLVPFMGILYFGGCIAILIYNHSAFPEAFHAIFFSAFKTHSIAGGMMGVLVVGLQRALFSNESGIGSAAIAYSAVKTRHPITEGFVGMLGPFFDTMVICMLTALVIVTTIHYNPQFAAGHTGVEMTSMAFERQISWSPYLLSVAVTLFAFSTLISWSYYGLKSWSFLVGETRIRELIFKIIFCIVCIFGTTISINTIVKFSDALIFLICIPNILGLYLLAPGLKRDLKEYTKEIKK
ncbi:MAG: alanine:cation symporter family protein [Gammaproteobacteria bacterium]|nr:alanine:cation symporter family protein [Gammaproteobacteria bacterium]